MITSNQNNDHIYLLKALTLANERRGFCAPNPSVGAVITDQFGNILAEGFHQGPGMPHAEIEALKQYHANINSTLYVTLEPCCHFGRTPPCTHAIIKANIKRVVYGYKDPNPIVSGKGAIDLQHAGITCHYAYLPEIDQFYQSYHYWHQHKKPFVTAKIAMTLDGKIAGDNHQRIQITGEPLQQKTHQFRKTSDAILTTAKTIHCDDPKLNVRQNETTIAKPLYIVDRRLSINLNATVFSTAKSVTLFHSNLCDDSEVKRFNKKGIVLVAIEEDEHGLNLHQLLRHIGNDGVHDLWVEAGGALFETLLKQNLIQRALIYIAPTWLGVGQLAFKDYHSFNNENITWHQVGRDMIADISFI